MTRPPADPPEILLVEDSPTDALMTREALTRSGIDHRLLVAHDGLEAMSILSRAPQPGEAPRPTLVLLDLNMPRMDGCELLAWMRTQTALRSTPAVVLTTSAHEDDVNHCYAHGANAYVVKDIDFYHFAEKIEVLMRFWFKVASLPSVAAGSVAGMTSIRPTARRSGVRWE